jgi:hypothetical protein
MVCIFDPVCELLPPWTKELYCTCVLLPLYCTSSLTSSPLPPFPMYSTVYRQCVPVEGWGGFEMYCGPYSAGVLHSVSDQIQNLQNCFTTPNKMTDMKGLVSLKFLRPCVTLSKAFNVCCVHQIWCLVPLTKHNPFLQRA